MFQEDPLVKQQYKANPAAYPDVRRFYTEKGIRKRQDWLQTTLKKPGLVKKQRRRWALENAMLAIKHRIYFTEGAPVWVSALRLLLECTDFQRWSVPSDTEEGRRRDREKHTLPLLQLVALKTELRPLLGLQQQ
jgi:hypothetical protein